MNIRKNFGIFRIKLSQSINLPNNMGEHIVNMIINEVTRAGQQIQASYGWNKNTRCFFAKLLN